MFSIRNYCHRDKNLLETLSDNENESELKGLPEVDSMNLKAVKVEHLSSISDKKKNWNKKEQSLRSLYGDYGNFVKQPPGNFD